MEDLPHGRGRRPQYGRPQFAWDIRAKSRDRREFRLLGGDEEFGDRLGRRRDDEILARSERLGPGRQDGVSRHQGRWADRRPAGVSAPGYAIDAGLPSGLPAVTGATIIDGKATPKQPRSCAIAIGSPPFLPRSWSATIQRARSMFATRHASVPKWGSLR